MDIDYFKLYELFSKEEQELLKAYHDRTRFYIGLITAILAATVAGLMKASAWYHFSFLTVGPFILIAVSRIAHEDTERAYAGWLSGVTRRAKLEDVIGLTKPRDEEGEYWGVEAIIPERYIRARRKTKSSIEFEKNRLHRGHHKWAKRVLDVFSLVGLVGFISVVALSIYTFLNP